MLSSGSLMNPGRDRAIVRPRGARTALTSFASENGSRERALGWDSAYCTRPDKKQHLASQSERKIGNDARNIFLLHMGDTGGCGEEARCGNRAEVYSPCSADVCGHQENAKTAAKLFPQLGPLSGVRCSSIDPEPTFRTHGRRSRSGSGRGKLPHSFHQPKRCRAENHGPNTTPRT